MCCKMSVLLLCCKPMFCLVFAFSAAFTVFVVLTVCPSVVYFVYDFIINKYKCCRTVTTSVTDCCSGWSGDSCNERKYSQSLDKRLSCSQKTELSPLLSLYIVYKR